MAASITCPLCKSAVELLPGELQPSCPEDHALTEQELALQLQAQVERALWSAVKALEDEAAHARWALSNGRPTSTDPAAAQREADLLRGILTGRG